MLPFKSDIHSLLTAYQESCHNLHTLVHLAPPSITLLLLVPVNWHRMNRDEVATLPATDMLKLVVILNCGR